MMSFAPATAPDENTPEGLFAAACDHVRQAAVLASVESLLGWDERTLMPPEAGGYRAEQMAALATLVHQQRTSPRQGERLAKLADGPLARGGEPHVAATIRLLKHDYDKQARLPARLVKEMAKTCVEAQQAWTAARAESSWPQLAPWLERVFALKREQAACPVPDRDPDDALRDAYEPGARWPAVAERFDRLRGGIVQLVDACVGARQRPDDALLKRRYPVDAQKAFVQQVAAQIGFDFGRGRIDTTDHPFCSTMGPNDCRITTRWDEHFLPTALFGVLHEAGHGLYEQGLPREWYGLPPGEAASLGIHESQSRLWENMVGRSAAFWRWCFPLARRSFPETLAGATADDVQRSLMTVAPSFIRVEADEVTYNLHVMMRFDLERAVVQGTLSVADLPEAWDDRFAKDFGIRPPSAAEGVLQDIHWSAGLIGYFPTYTLGNMHAAQLMAAADRALPDLDAEMAAGRFAGLLGWMREHVHRRGRMLESDALVQEASGSPPAEKWLLDSLRSRYGAAHGFA
ncbi:MAG: carboxypeptidase M32 [Planctomycetia bacterium]